LFHVNIAEAMSMTVKISVAWTVPVRVMRAASVWETSRKVELLNTGLPVLKRLLGINDAKCSFVHDGDWNPVYFEPALNDSTAARAAALRFSTPIF
jgi:hypothetical protein